MRLISWNVHFDISEEQYEHIMTKKPDILILDECYPSGFNLASKDWKNCVYYNDPLYDNTEGSSTKNLYGIAVFSNRYRFEYTECFNRNFRFVIPLKVFDGDEFLFYLFAVWTKNKPVSYIENITKAMEFSGYKEYVSDKALFTGDFNAPATKENRSSYDKILKTGLIDCASPEDVLKPTYSHSKDIRFYTADFCLATEKMLEAFNIKETVCSLDENIDSKDKYLGLSDHCPLIIEITGK